MGNYHKLSAISKKNMHMAMFWFNLFGQFIISRCTLRPEQTGQLLQIHLMKEHFIFFMQISLKFVPNGPIENKSSLL